MTQSKKKTEKNVSQLRDFMRRDIDEQLQHASTLMLGESIQSLYDLTNQI